jgi:hypothetical protein
LVDRYLARVVVAGVFGMAGLGVACSGSSSTLMPTSPSPSATRLVVTAVTPRSGPISGGDVVTVTGEGFKQGATVMVGGVAAELVRLGGSLIRVRTAAHAAGSVDIDVMNPDGESARLPQSYTFGVFSVAASPSVVTADGSLTVSFVAPSGRGCNGGGDWIALYHVGDPDETGSSNGHSDIWYDHVCGSTSGARTLTAPAQPGEYEFRFMNGDTSVARSNTVTILAL